jgi:hypothetical protein
VLPATAESVSVARRMLSGWLGMLRWPDEESLGIVLAVNEAFPTSSPTLIRPTAQVALSSTFGRRSISRSGDGGSSRW